MRSPVAAGFPRRPLLGNPVYSGYPAYWYSVYLDNPSRVFVPDNRWEALNTMTQQRRREFLVREHNQQDVLARILLGMEENDFSPTAQRSETSIKFSENRGFWKTFAGEFAFVTVTLTPAGEDLRVRILADAEGKKVDELMDRVTNIVGGEVALEEAKTE